MNCHGSVGVGCDNIGSVVACFLYRVQVEDEWQNSLISLDIVGQNMASLAVGRQYLEPRCE